MSLALLVKTAGKGLIRQVRAEDVEGRGRFGVHQGPHQGRSKRLGFFVSPAQRLTRRADEGRILLWRLNLDAPCAEVRRRCVRVALR
jgi:hypothetical protein